MQKRCGKVRKNFTIELKMLHLQKNRKGKENVIQKNRARNNHLLSIKAKQDIANRRSKTGRQNLHHKAHWEKVIQELCRNQHAPRFKRKPSIQEHTEHDR